MNPPDSTVTKPAQDLGNGFADQSGAVAVVVLALLESLLLLFAQESQADAWSPVLRSGWYTLAIAVPSMLCLLLQSLRDRFAWIAGGGLLIVLTILARFSGGQCLPAEFGNCEDVLAPYTAALAAALFMLTPFLQTLRAGGRGLPYPRLFHFAWDNALTLAAALVFTVASWLILWLWAGLFKVVQINLFSDLFAETRFAFPVTGLFAGLGLALGRTQSGALRTALRVCLALGRGLLPLIAVVAVIFALTLLFTGIAPLWQTRHATPLLLSLVFGMVVLVNSVFQEGESVAPYGSFGRHLIEAALLCLPVYALVAAYSLTLRVQQYGWTPDRLWAAILAVVAVLYALSYALAIAWRRGVWLRLLAPANTAIALIVIAVLLLSQSALFDLRSISVRSQLARLDRGAVALKDFDFEALRWQLGAPGLAALRVLRADPSVSADPQLVARVDGVLAMRDRWGVSQPRSSAQLAARLTVLPQGISAPAELLTVLENKSGAKPNAFGFLLDECLRSAAPCYLIAIDLTADAGLEWVLVGARDGGYAWPVFASEGGQWRQRGVLAASDGDYADHADHAQRQEIASALAQGKIAAETPAWKDLKVGQRRYSFREENY